MSKKNFKPKKASLSVSHSPKKGNVKKPLLIGSGSDEATELLDYVINEAEIKDFLCNYKYKVIRGAHTGDVIQVKGSGEIKDGLRKAIAKFNVHLAAIDDAFLVKGVEVVDIDKLHNDDLTYQYQVHGFLIKTGKNGESIVIRGKKTISTSGGFMDLETPPIYLDGSSSYKWYNELKDAADKARGEVSLYKEGNCTPREPVIEGDPEQLSMYGGATKIAHEEAKEVDQFQEQEA